MLDFGGLGSVRMHARNVECVKEGVLILRELTGNWDLSRVIVNFDETHELASSIIILTRSQCFVVVRS